MTTREVLPAALAVKIDALGDAAWESEQKGDYDVAESKYLEAWKLIPAPIYIFDCYPQTFSFAIVEFYRDSHQFEKAEEWLKVVRRAYEPLNEASLATINFLEATVWHDGGKFDEAFEAFSGLHEKYGLRPFQDGEPRWQQFFESRQNA